MLHSSPTTTAPKGWKSSTAVEVPDPYLGTMRQMPVRVTAMPAADTTRERTMTSFVRTLPFAAAFAFSVATPAAAETITECIRCTTTCDNDGENCVTECINVPCPHQGTPSKDPASFGIDDLRSTPGLIYLDPTSTPFLMLDGRTILVSSGTIKSGITITRSEANLLTAASLVGDSIELGVDGKVVELDVVATKTGFKLYDMAGTGTVSVSISK